MAENISFEDSLFYLNEVIKTLNDGIKLDIDAEMFLDKIVDDILFVESSLTILLSNLKEHRHLINRADLLKKLMRTKVKYAELLNMLANGEASIAINLKPFIPKFIDFKIEQQDHIDEIEALLNGTLDAAGERTDTVSQEEFKFLLMEENSEEPA